jgi:GTP-dependent dephospho-CoA kinase
MRAAGTRSASSEERVWVVPESLRPVLAERYGPVYAGKPAEKRIRHLGPFASCGDEVTRLAIATGNLPIVGVVDFKTGRTGSVERGSYAALSARGRRRVANPAGMLTERLRRTVKEFLLAGGGLLEVDGEEDLAALALVESLPVGATVIYGIPGSGVSFVAVDALSKEHVRGLIAQMELRKVDLGA